MEDTVVAMKAKAAIQSTGPAPQPTAAPARTGFAKPDIPALFVGVPQLAAMLGLSKSRVYALLARGEIPCTRIGPSLRIPLAVVEKYVNDAVREVDEHTGPKA